MGFGGKIDEIPEDDEISSVFTEDLDSAPDSVTSDYDDDDEEEENLPR